MQFIKTDDKGVLAHELETIIREALKTTARVVWLVPGGSNIPVVVTVLNNLVDASLFRLTIMLTDERYGSIGHPDSNMHQLKQAGFVEHDANVLQSLFGVELPKTIEYLEKAVQKVFAEADTIIGFFGMGNDGHMAGILPDSPAISSDAMVVGYDSDPYARITLTPKALEYVTVAVVGAFGTDKLPALTKLRDVEVSIREQPAQLLKDLPKTILINDQITNREPV